MKSATRNRFWGKYRGICRDNNDPRMQGRIRVEVPAVFGPRVWTTWAMPCLHPGSFDVPEEGEGVWVEFEAGDPYRPVWVGVWYRGAGDETTAPFQSTHPALTDMDGAVVDTDQTEHAAHEVDDAEHKEFHDHETLFYTPHRRGLQSALGAILEFVDHPGWLGRLNLRGRFGRLLTMGVRGFVRLAGFFTQADEDDNPWTDLAGTPIDAVNELIFADPQNEGSEPGIPAGQYVLLKTLYQAFLELRSTPGEEHVNLEDFWGQHLKIWSVDGSEYVEILDRAGQKILMDVSTGTLRVQDQEGNFVLLENGKITVETVSGDVHINVPAGQKVYTGGAAGQPLATEKFVRDIYNMHTHIAQGPGSPTLPPMPMWQAPLSPGEDITDKTISE